VARERDGPNRLVEWAGQVERGPGDAVELDAVDPGTLYGLRTPGARAVYTATETPRDSLRSIAESLTDPDEDE
jgi:DNA-binding sugar fermentation-stimulating protein